MSLGRYPGRFLVVTAVPSLLLLGLSGVLAGYLYAEQARTADVLGENIGSRRAAADLAEALTDLAALHRGGARDVRPLQDRSAELLAEIDRRTDKPDEAALAREVRRGLAAYLAAARRPGAAADDLAARVSDGPLPACRHLLEYNAQQIEASEADHRTALRRMADGLAVVGGLGSVGGLVLGWGLARRLRRSLTQLLVRVQGASDRLGAELPAVEVADPDGDQAADLVGKVEQVVRRLQQQERDIRRAERLAAVGQLAAGVAHEIRNPLTAVKLLIQTARRDPSAGGLEDEDLDLIEREIRRMERSLQTLLDYARPPKLCRARCDPAAIARDALALVRGRAEAQGIAVRLAAPEVPVALDADPDQLRQVLLNLVLNALDGMPAGGTLDVTVSAPTPGSVVVAVADTGPGIAPEVRPRLFEPFATGKETGLGLGLVVSRRIVEDHGGTIGGENQPGGGARFTVTLPTRPQTKND